MLRIATILLICITPSVATPVDCEGCFQEDYTWGSGSVWEIYTFTPGAGNTDGVCNASTCNSSPGLQESVWVADLCL
jgi:hypothetical protein